MIMITQIVKSWASREIQPNAVIYTIVATVAVMHVVVDIASVVTLVILVRLRFKEM